MSGKDRTFCKIVSWDSIVHDEEGGMAFENIIKLFCPRGCMIGKLEMRMP